MPAAARRSPSHRFFGIKTCRGQPGRFYLLANQSLTITGHFVHFGSDLNKLRKRLRKMPQVQLFDSFPPYASAFRRHFGIENEQALNLFHQTVSMKSVGNLTDFVREHMLEACDVQPRIEALIDHFNDLSRAHEAVLKAKRQIERLTPLAADCDKHREISRQSTHYRVRPHRSPEALNLHSDSMSRKLAIKPESETKSPP